MKRYQGNTHGISPGISHGNATLRSGKSANREIGDPVRWSPRNLWLMRQLGREYSNVKQPASKIENLNQADSDLENIKKLASSVPWQSTEQFQQILIAGSEEQP